MRRRRLAICCERVIMSGVLTTSEEEGKRFIFCKSMGANGIRLFPSFVYETAKRVSRKTQNLILAVYLTLSAATFVAGTTLLAKALGSKLIVIKTLSKRETTFQIFFLNNIVGLAIAPFAVLFIWQSPILQQSAARAGLGLLMARVQASFVNAAARADASHVTPYLSAVLGLAALLDWTVFSVVSDRVSIIDAAITLTDSGLLAWREGWLKRA